MTPSHHALPPAAPWALRILALAFLATASLPAAPIVPDQYDKLFLKCDGTGTNFVDSSTANPKTVTAHGNATQLPIKFNRTAGFFNGTTDYVMVPSHSDFNVGTGDYDYEFFVNFASDTSSFVFDIANQKLGVFYVQYSSQVNIYQVGRPSVYFTWTPTLNTWHHFRVQRVSGVTSCYVDGVQRGSPFTGSDNIAAADLYIGRQSDSAAYHHGWIKELRFSNVARPPVVPTSPYTPDANTMLLMHFDSPAPSPLGPAIYCDGGGDYLSVGKSGDFDFGADPFTLEMWVKFDSFPDVRFGLMGKMIGNNEQCWGWLIAPGASKYFQLYGGVNSASVSVPLPQSLVHGRWYHLAVSKSDKVRFFIDGAKMGEDQTPAASYSGADTGVWVGAAYGTPNFKGYIREARITRGTARYTSNFTPSQTGFAVDGDTRLYVKGDESNGTGTDYPPVHDGTFVKATGPFTVNYYPYFATDPTRSLTGSREGTSWLGLANVSQRFHVDMGVKKVLTRLYYENQHHYGGATSAGVRRFTLWASNDSSAFDEMTYAVDTGWTRLFTSQAAFDQHISSDAPDPKFITVTNSTAFRYYAVKCEDGYGDPTFIGLRRLEFQTSWFEDSSVSPNSVMRNGDTKIKYTEDYRSCIFKDETGKCPYPVGAAKVDFVAPFGTGVGFLPYGANGSFLSADQNTDFDFGTGPWTLECFLRTKAGVGDETTGGTGTIAAKYKADSQGWVWKMEMRDAYKNFSVYDYNNAGTRTIQPADNFVDNSWYHLAVSCNGQTLYAFVNGVLQGTAAVGASGYNGGSQVLSVGSYNNGTWSYPLRAVGLDNIRISRGIARYTSTFNPPVDAGVENPALTVLSAHGGAVPGSLTCDYGSVVTLRVVNSPVYAGTLATQYVCTGASVLSNAFTQVSPTNVTLTLTNNATLTWLWQTNYWLDTAVRGSGTVDRADGWMPAGTSVTVRATAGRGYHFVQWQGAGGPTANPIVFTMNHFLLTLAAIFSPDPPIVTNVVVTQRPGTKVVDIRYDLVGLSTNSGAVSLVVYNGDQCVNAVSVSGDIGFAVPTGAGRRIVWDAGADWAGQVVLLRFGVAGAAPTGPPPAEMALIPAGTFRMGDTFAEGDPDERPLHDVRVSALCVDPCEVTKAKWDELYAWATARGYGFDAPARGAGANHPVQSNSWYDCAKWCNARSEKEGRVPCYYTDAGQTAVYRSGQVDVSSHWVRWDSGGYRLPTEAEWEKAARGVMVGHRFPWGGVDTIAHSHANYNSTNAAAYDVSPTRGYHPAYNDGTEPYTSPVGAFAPNSFGLYDMAGNVWEWCWDWYDAGWYANAAATAGDCQGPASGAQRVFRGGGWGTHASGCRVAYRNAKGAGERYSDVGFRTVRAPVEVSSPWVSRSVDTRDFTLTVVSAYGQPSPAAGGSLYPWQAVVTGAVASAERTGATNYLCAGWAGSGSVPASGSTNRVTFAMAANSSLAWLWRTQYWITVQATAGGGVNPSNGWFDAGQTGVSVRATADAGYHFANWTGDVVSTQNPLPLALTRPYSLLARFAWDRPTAAFAAAPTNGTQPLTVTFTDQSSGPIATREWDFTNDGVIDRTDPADPLQHTYDLAGAYSVRLRVTGPGGSHTLVRTNYVVVLPPPSNRAPVVCVAAPQVYLPSLGDMVTLDASCSTDADGDPLLYSWREYYLNPRRGLIPIGSESLSRLDLYFTDPGRYRFDVQASDGEFLSADTASIMVYVPGLRGEVTIAGTGGLIPVPGANVVAYGTYAEAAARTNALDAAVTDSRGRYAMAHLGAGLASWRDYHFRVERAGFKTNAPVKVTIYADPTDHPFAGFQIERPVLAALPGTVRDASSGAAIVGATVKVMPAQVDPVASLAGGQFMLVSVPHGTWTVQIQKSGYRPEVRDINICAALTNLAIRLSAGAQTVSVRGRATVAGTESPVEGATVSFGTSTSPQTDAAGAYTLANLFVGTYAVTVQKTGYETLRFPQVALTGGVNRLDFELYFAGSGPSVFGRVVDARGGQPVRQAVAGVEGTSGLLIRSGVTDPAGWFELQDVPPGLQSFRVSAPGYVAQTLSRAISSYADLGKVRLARAANWRRPGTGAGAVVPQVAQARFYRHGGDAAVVLDGQPSGGGLQYAWTEVPQNPTLGLLDEVSRTLAAPQVSAFARPGLYVFGLQVMRQGVASPGRATVTVYQPGLAGNVHVSPSDGVKGVGSTEVRLYGSYAAAAAWGPSFVDYATSGGTAPLGDFDISGVSTGAYWLAARKDGLTFVPYGPVRCRVSYAAAARQMAVNLSSSECLVRGQITDRDTGAGLENVRVVLTPGSASDSFRTTTAADGRFVLDGVPEIPLTVMLMKQGYRTEAIPVTIRRGVKDVIDYPLERATNRAVRLSGRVTANYRGLPIPVTHAEVLLGSGFLRTFTDADGEYTFEGLAPGNYFGTVRKPGYQARQLFENDVKVIDADTEQDVALSFAENGPVVRGVLIGPSGETAANAQVTVLAPAPAGLKGRAEEARGAAVWLASAPVRTDLGGTFQLAGVAEGERLLQVVLPNGQVYTNRLYVSGTLETVVALEAESRVPYDWWVRQMGTNAPPCGDADDTDRDGRTTWEEYVLDSAPEQSNAPFGAQMTRSGGQWRFAIDQSSTARIYDVWWSTNLLQTNWWHSFVGDRRGTGRQLLLSVTNDARRPRCFYRPAVSVP